MLQPEDDGPRPLSWEEVNVGRCWSFWNVLEQFGIVLAASSS